MEQLFAFLSLFKSFPGETGSQAAIGAFGAVVGILLREIIARPSKQVHTNLEVAQTNLASAQEMATVVDALKAQIEALMIENERLRTDLADARHEIFQLSKKLDRMEFWFSNYPKGSRPQ